MTWFLLRYPYTVVRGWVVCLKASGRENWCRVAPLARRQQEVSVADVSTVQMATGAKH